jgi:hypothetical protein
MRLLLVTDLSAKQFILEVNQVFLAISREAGHRWEGSRCRGSAESQLYNGRPL